MVCDPLIAHGSTNLVVLPGTCVPVAPIFGPPTQKPLELEAEFEWPNVPMASKKSRRPDSNHTPEPQAQVRSCDFLRGLV